jgi:hypothetical protein
MTKPKKVRDREFVARIKEHGLSGAPSISAAYAASLPKVEEVARFKISDQMVPLTMQKAAEYVDLPVFRGERNVTDSWAQKLLDEMIRGNFNWDQVVIASCWLDTTRYKINGQHTCWARIDRPVDYNPTVREIVYRVEREDQLRHIYKTYDQGRGRSEQQVMKVTLMGLQLDSTIKIGVATKVAIGVRFLRFEDRQAYRRVRDDEMASIIAGILPVFQAVCLFYQSIDHSSHAVMMRQPVAAAVVATFMKDVVDATAFWTDVAEGTNLIKGEHRWLLHQYLQKTNLSPTAKTRTEVVQVARAEDMFRACISIWNKWRRGEKITVVRPTNNRVPVM